MAKLSLRPTKKTEEEQMQEFVSQANSDPTPTVSGNDEDKPWNDPRVRDDVIKAVSLRMPEPYILKLQYLSEKTHMSQQEIIRNILLPYLDSEIQKHLGGEHE